MDAAISTRHRELLQLVADPQRWKILLCLEQGGLTVSELVDRLDIAQPAVSHHLGRLRRAGLVAATSVGRRRRYRWARPSAGTAEAELQQFLCRWFRAAPARPSGGLDPRARPRALEVHLL